MVKQPRSAIAASSPADTAALVVDDPLLKEDQAKLTELRRESQKLQSMYQADSYQSSGGREPDSCRGSSRSKKNWLIFDPDRTMNTVRHRQKRTC